MKNKFFASYACDSNQEGSACGPETILRLEGLANVLKQYDTTKNYVLFGAGKNWYKKKKPAFTLSRLMRHKLLTMCQKLHVSIPTVVEPKEQAWGSFNESIQMRNSARSLNCTHLTLITSWYHIPRLRLIWFLIAPDIKVQFISVPAKAKLVDLSEPIKVILVFIMFILAKVRIIKSSL